MAETGEVEVTNNGLIQKTTKLNKDPVLVLVNAFLAHTYCSRIYLVSLGVLCSLDSINSEIGHALGRC